MTGKWDVEIKKSKRKTLSISIGEDRRIHVKAPVWVSDRTVYDFLEEKRAWIEKQLGKLEESDRQLMAEGYLTKQEIESLGKMAMRVLPGRVAYFAERIGVTYGRITIRCQKSRWGSCSSKGNLNFNCLLMLAPTDVADYVVVHELCHRLEMNHSRRFWELVRQEMPDYEKKREWLRENGATLMRRMNYLS